MTTVSRRGAVSLVGYVGPSKKADHVRLYTGLDFQSYYEVPRRRLSTRTQSTPKTRQRSTVMIKPDAALDFVQVSKQSGTASFLAGGIAGAFLTSQAQAGIIHPTTTIFTRQTLFVFCPTREICPTRDLSCRPTLIPAICEGIPGGTVGEEAVAVQAANAPSLFCASFNIPCHSRPQHCLVGKEPPPEQMAAAIAASVLCNTVNIPCGRALGDTARRISRAFSLKPPTTCKPRRSDFTPPRPAWHARGRSTFAPGRESVGRMCIYCADSVAIELTPLQAVRSPGGALKKSPIALNEVS